MNNSLVMYPNLQYEPISIPAFTIVEVYRIEIASGNGLGYFILPIEGKSDFEIEQEIREKAQLSQPSGFSNLAILNGGSYDHRIVYAVWYNEPAPTYPQEPVVTSYTAQPALDVWNRFNVSNDGAPAFITVTLTCSSFDSTIEFYINEDYFAIDIEHPVNGVNEIEVSKEGVRYNNKPINSFKMSSAPKLKAGINSIEVKGIGVTNFNIKYRTKY